MNKALNSSVFIGSGLFRAGVVQLIAWGAQVCRHDILSPGARLRCPALHFFISYVYLYKYSCKRLKDQENLCIIVRAPMREKGYAVSANSFRQVGNGQWAYCVDAYVFGKDGQQTPPKVGTLAILCKDLQAFGNRGEAVPIAQFYELVIPGTILTKHVFQGLQRPLRTDGDSSADEKMLIYARKPSFNSVWYRGPQGHSHRTDAPVGKVFVVIVMPNNSKHCAQYPEVDGWINAWTWIDEDPGLSEAPVKWVDRYRTKLWTRGGV
jgi:hypothetical protein